MTPNRMTHLGLPALVMGCAAVVGLTLGIATSTKSTESSATTSSSPAVAHSRATIEAPSTKRRATRPVTDRALEALKSGNLKDLRSLLHEIVTDTSQPPLVAGLYRDALVERMVHLGAFQELLDPVEFPVRERQAITTAAVRAFAESDPTAALEAAKRLAPENGREAAKAAVFGVLGRTDPARGLALIGTSPADVRLKISFFSEWAKVNPVAAAEAELGKQAKGEWPYKAALRVWAVRDPKGAWAWIEAHPSGDDYAQYAYLEAIAVKDPVRALDEMASKPKLNSRFDNLADEIGARLGRDVHSANAAVDRLPPGDGRTKLICGLVRGLTDRPSEAIAWIKTLLPGERETALPKLFEDLGRSEPDAAIDLAQKELDGPQRKKAIRSIITVWGRRDIGGLLADSPQKVDRDALLAALPEIIDSQDHVDPAGIERLLATSGQLDPALRATILTSFGAARARYGIPENIRQLSASDQAAFAEGAWKKSFQIAPDSVDELRNMLPPEKQALLANRIGEAMSRANLPATAEYLAQLPEGEKAGPKREALQKIVQDWAYSSPDAAAAFIGRLPAGETKDAAAQSLATEMRNFDLAGATRLAAGTTNPKIRNALIENLARDWARVDPAQGRIMMAALLRSPEERSRAAALYPVP